MAAKKEKKAPFLVLLIVDGLGIAPKKIGNILSVVKIKNYPELILKYPAAALRVPAGLRRGVSTSDNYFIIGTGNFTQKKSISLPEKLEKEGIKTLLISGPDKYPEMNFFFTGRKKIADNDFLTIKKNKAGKTFALAADIVIKTVKEGKYGFIAVALSDLDSAAASGDAVATAEAALEIDKIFSKITKAVLGRGGVVIITAAAGRAEKLIDPQTEIVNKKNTANPVPFILIGERYEGQTLNFPEAPDGDLALVQPTGDISNITPTILEILVPSEKEKKSFI